MSLARKMALGEFTKAQLKLACINTGVIETQRKGKKNKGKKGERKRRRNWRMNQVLLDFP